MNKLVILNCKNFKCNRNDKGDCKLSHISLASDGSLIVSKLICEDAEPIHEPLIQKATDGDKSMQKM